MSAETPNPYPRVEMPEDEIERVTDVINKYCQKNGLSGEEEFLRRYHLSSVDEVKVTISPADINYEEVDYRLYRKQADTEEYKLFLKLDRFYEEKYL